MVGKVKNHSDKIKYDAAELRRAIRKLEFTTTEADGSSVKFNVTPNIVIQNFWIRAKLDGQSGLHRVGLLRTYTLDGVCKYVTASIVTANDKFNVHDAELLCDRKFLNVITSNRFIQADKSYKCKAGQVAFVGRFADTVAEEVQLIGTGYPEEISKGIREECLKRLGILGVLRTKYPWIQEKVLFDKLVHNLTYTPVVNKSKLEATRRRKKLIAKNLSNGVAEARVKRGPPIRAKAVSAIPFQPIA